METLIVWGLPTAVTGFLFWLLKRHIDKSAQKTEEREQRVEQLMLYILKDCRATTVLATATAKAVQRIPDAHCNGDMTEALKKATEIQKQEKDFVFNQGIEHIFGTN